MIKCLIYLMLHIIVFMLNFVFYLYNSLGFKYYYFFFLQFKILNIVNYLFLLQSQRYVT